ncbi:hypothetical protein TNCV_1531831 [Trichonephila clavipes]|nr:hypothetical protein TNCV_1531831 [Trichonephila clavipes]
MVYKTEDILMLMLNKGAMYVVFPVVIHCLWEKVSFTGKFASQQELEKYDYRNPSRCDKSHHAGDFITLGKKSYHQGTLKKSLGLTLLTIFMRLYLGPLRRMSSKSKLESTWALSEIRLCLLELLLVELF